jgi:hypothetical protein
VAGTVEEFAPGSAKLASVKTSLASAAGISESLVTVEVNAGSVALLVTMPQGAATSVVSQIQSGTLKQLGAVTVESITTSAPTTETPTSVVLPCAKEPACFDATFTCPYCCFNGTPRAAGALREWRRTYGAVCIGS